MPIAASWTEPVRDARRAVADVGHLLRFRAATGRRRAAHAVVPVVFGGLTLASATVPGLLEGAGDDEGRAFEMLLLLPTAFAGFLALALLSAVASGGGRELLGHEPASVHPISPTTDHLGALLLAPLNIAWLLQGWGLLGLTAFAIGDEPVSGLVAAETITLLWLLAATAWAQVVAWSLEAVRRRRHGIAAVRGLAVAAAAAAVVLQVTGHVTDVLDQVPTRWVVVGMIDGFTPRWWATLGVVLALAVAGVVVGAVPAHLAARRSPRDEARAESGHREPRPHPRTPFGALVRTDRASVWRAVPMRRGLAVLAVGPGVVALAGGLPWSTILVLPGLVASGAALLFGVNAWCLDGRGGLWRESLPVSAGTVFAARAWVVAEFLLVASLVTVALAALRAGAPSAPEVASLVAALLVVTAQVTGAAMRWSARRPYAVDLRSARATPAPPMVMVGYSARLAVTTTLTGLVFSGLARLPEWRLPVILAVVFLAWSMLRLVRAYYLWEDPADRARVVTAVAA